LLVPKLSRAKFQDNNEFLQWCYSYIKKHHPGVEKTYKAHERREEARSKSNALKQKKPTYAQQKIPPNRVQIVSNAPLKSTKTAPNVQKTLASGLPRQQSAQVLNLKRSKGSTGDSYFQPSHDNSFSDSEAYDRPDLYEDDQMYYSEGVENEYGWDYSVPVLAVDLQSRREKGPTFPEPYNPRKHSLRVAPKGQTQQKPSLVQRYRTDQGRKHPEETVEIIQQVQQEEIKEEQEETESQHEAEISMEVQEDINEEIPVQSPPSPTSPTTLHFIREFMKNADENLFNNIDTKLVVMLEENEKYVAQIEDILSERNHYLEQLCKIENVCQTFIEQDIEVEAALNIQNIIRH
jgi:hypothetical protein